jgi:glycosyltransferase involved in cell wall biosynthesis
MNAGSTKRGSLFFCYADPTGFSGQKAATELVINGLSRRGWRCRRLPMPVLNRGHGGELGRWRYLAALLRAWGRALRLLGSPSGRLSVSLGQTRVAFLRDGVPLLLGWAVLRRERIVATLNGNVFMQWPGGSFNLRVFCFLLRRAGRVTVVGDGQRERLLALGLPADRVVVVVNSCELSPIPAAAVEAKHRDGPVRCLFLSSLIDTKGFPEYLEALGLLSSALGPPLEAVLCGRLVASDFSSRFPDLADAEAWIERQLDKINRSVRVRCRWIKGATGRDKEALFREANIFVLPTRYAVEAQPLVLLEAMASGCAIITSRVGEIATILDDRSAVLLPGGGAAAVAAELERLAADAPGRRLLAQAAHARFLERYQVERHLDAWEQLLLAAGAAAKDAA